jgi:hypothetical protein
MPEKMLLPLFLAAGALLLCLLATAALAVPALAASEAHLLHYTARLHGVPLLDITFCIALTDTNYDAAIEAHTLGIAEFLVHGRADGHAHGSIFGARVHPTGYEERGRLSGETHRMVIAYPKGDPVLVLMQPPQDKYRLPVPASALPGALDGLSALTLETLAASRDNACQGEALVYDGFQLRRATARTAGYEMLKPDKRSIFTGRALRCDTTSVMLAGFLKDKPIPPQARPRYSTAWFGPLTAGGPNLPLRLSFDADILGNIIVDLDHASAPGTPNCVIPPKE